jgi:hypothetical protein
MASYSDRFVAFIDILGFKYLIDRSSTQNSGVTVDGIREALRPPKPAAEGQIILGQIGDISKSGHRQTTFSDSIVISTEPTPNGLVHLVNHSDRIARKLFEVGYLCRGGIARGDLYHESEGTLFGPAVLRAYELEQTPPGYPRILLDEKVSSFAGQINERGFRRMLRKDEDGKWMVHILRLPSLLYNEGKWNARRTGDSTDAVVADGIRSKIVATIDHQIARLSAVSAKPPKAPQKTEPLEKWEWFKRYVDGALMSDEVLDSPFP